MLSALDTAIVAYIASHVPITLMFDLQAVLPADWFPSALRAAVAHYCEALHDVYMARPPAWFRAMVWAELLLQLPFFLAALHAYRRRARWIRLPAIVYGVHVASFVYVILFALWHEPTLTTQQCFWLTGIYAPYLLLPLLIVYRFARSERPFDERPAAKVKL